ncbi:MAG: metallophosphoesterase [Treponema sp.]|nr:metallophosphoesterase [Treponema sp.]
MIRKNKFVKIYLSFFLLFFILLINSCDYDFQRLFFRGPTPDVRAENITQLQSLVLNASSLDFMVITDLHFGNDKQRAVKELFESVSNKKIDFIVLLGDVVESGKDEYFVECENFIENLKKYISPENNIPPIYVVLGNHDIYCNGFDRWKKLNFNASQGATFYKFETECFYNQEKYLRSWYFIDTASGILGQRQLSALDNTLRSDFNPKFVFTHYPVYTDMNFVMFFRLSDDRERAKLIDAFDKNNVEMVFSGHWHPGGSFDYGNFKEICFPSFLENANETSNWFFLSLNERDKILTVETHSVSSSVYDKSETQIKLN